MGLVLGLHRRELAVGDESDEGSGVEFRGAGSWEIALLWEGDEAVRGRHGGADEMLVAQRSVENGTAAWDKEPSFRMEIAMSVHNSCKIHEM